MFGKPTGKAGFLNSATFGLFAVLKCTEALAMNRLQAGTILKN
jgi:hypothetical protein